MKCYAKDCENPALPLGFPQGMNLCQEHYEKLVGPMVRCSQCGGLCKCESANTGKWSCMTCKEVNLADKTNVPPPPPPLDPRDVANQELRERSGKVQSTDPLVSFIYQLLRDHLSIGVIEHLVRDSPSVPTMFTNGYLARYAIDVAMRLKEKPDGPAVEP